MGFLNDRPTFGEVVRFKTIRKRTVVDNGKASFFIDFKTKKGIESFGVLLGTVSEKEPIPPTEELTKRLNDLGWISEKQLFKAFGKRKGLAIYDQIYGIKKQTKAKTPRRKKV